MFISIKYNCRYAPHCYIGCYEGSYRLYSLPSDNYSLVQYNENPSTKYPLFSKSDTGIMEKLKPYAGFFLIFYKIYKKIHTVFHNLRNFDLECYEFLTTQWLVTRQSS